MKTQLTVAPMVAVALLTLSGPVLAQENSQAQLYGTLSAAVIHQKAREAPSFRAGR